MCVVNVGEKMFHSLVRDIVKQLNTKMPLESFSANFENCAPSSSSFVSMPVKFYVYGKSFLCVGRVQSGCGIYSIYYYSKYVYILDIYVYIGTLYICI